MGVARGAASLVVSGLLSTSDVRRCTRSYPVRRVGGTVISGHNAKGGNFPRCLTVSNSFIVMVRSGTGIRSRTGCLGSGRALLVSASDMAGCTRGNTLRCTLDVVRGAGFGGIVTFNYSKASRGHVIVHPVCIDPANCGVLPGIGSFDRFSARGVRHCCGRVVYNGRDVRHIRLGAVLDHTGALRRSLHGCKRLKSDRGPLIMSTVLLTLRRGSFSARGLAKSAVGASNRGVFSTVSTRVREMGIRPRIGGGEIVSRFGLVVGEPILSRGSRQLNGSPLHCFTRCLRSGVLATVYGGSPRSMLNHFCKRFVDCDNNSKRALNMILAPGRVARLFARLTRVGPASGILSPYYKANNFLVTTVREVLARTGRRSGRGVEEGGLRNVRLHSSVFSVTAAGVVLHNSKGDGLVYTSFLGRGSRSVCGGNFAINLVGPPCSRKGAGDATRLARLGFVYRLLSYMNSNTHYIIVIPRDAVINGAGRSGVSGRCVLSGRALRNIVALGASAFCNMKAGPIVTMFATRRPRPGSGLIGFISFGSSNCRIFTRIKLVPASETTREGGCLLSY